MDSALVVCKKALFDHQYVPDWPKGDRRFDSPETYQQQYAWELEGRKLCATHWGGFGIGVNAWRDADVVFLCDEFHVPRRVTIARAQGLMSAKATEGALGDMKALNSTSPQVDRLHEGHLLRWTKQMALRGKGRHFDEGGVCGRQKVVCVGAAKQYERLIANAAQLFPGAHITRMGDTANTYAEKLLSFLSRGGLPNVLTTKQLGNEIGVPWRVWGNDVLKRSETQACMRSLGWRYESRKGPSGSRLLRDCAEASVTVGAGYPVFPVLTQDLGQDWSASL